MLALTCLVLGPLLQESLSIGRDLRCWIFSVLPSSYNTRPSSAGTWPFFEKLGLWLHLSSLGLVSIGCRCWLRWRTPSWGWWVLSRRGWLLLGHAWDWRVFLLLRFLLWFNRPIKHFTTPRAMLPLPQLIRPWWSLAIFDSSLQSIYLLEDVLERSTCFFCQCLSRTNEIPDYRTDEHFLRWSSMVSWTCTQYFSTQNSIPLLPWLWLVLLPPPTSWNSQWQRVKTSLTSYLVAMAPWCRSPTMRMTRVKWWPSFFPPGLVGHFHTSGSCHIFWWTRLRLVAL